MADRMTYYPAGTRVRLREFRHDLRPARGDNAEDGYPAPILVGALGTVVNGTPDLEGDIRVKWDQAPDNLEYWCIHHTEVGFADPLPDTNDPQAVEAWLKE